MPGVVDRQVRFSMCIEHTTGQEHFRVSSRSETNVAPSDCSNHVGGRALAWLLGSSGLPTGVLQNRLKGQCRTPLPT
jgi:hypothetical protein